MSRNRCSYQDLLGIWGIDYAPRDNPSVCGFADSQGLRCLFAPSDLDDLAHLNRPAVLSMFNPQGQKYYVTLIAIHGDHAQVKVAGRRRVSTGSAATKRPQWVGTFVYRCSRFDTPPPSLANPVR